MVIFVHGNCRKRSLISTSAISQVYAEVSRLGCSRIRLRILSFVDDQMEQCGNRNQQHNQRQSPRLVWRSSCKGHALLTAASRTPQRASHTALASPPPSPPRTLSFVFYSLPENYAIVAGRLSAASFADFLYDSPRIVQD